MAPQGERMFEWNWKAGEYQDKCPKRENSYKENDQLENTWSWLCSGVMVYEVYDITLYVNWTPSNLRCIGRCTNMDDKGKNNIDQEESIERKYCQQLPPYRLPTTYVEADDLCLGGKSIYKPFWEECTTGWAEVMQERLARNEGPALDWQADSESLQETPA